MPQKLPRSLAEPLRLLALQVIFFVLCVPAVGQDKASPDETKTTTEQNMFRASMQPLLKQYCIRCHNAEEMQSGIRLDQLDGSLKDRQLFLWKDILKQINDPESVGLVEL